MSPSDPAASDQGRFGPYGGRYVPEALIAALDELAAAYDKAKTDEGFQTEFQRLLTQYAGRPSLLYDAQRLSAQVGARVLLKREDLNHTGAHKINNVLGQVLLASGMGKTRVIAETGAGQHGVATATAAALFGLECVVYMGEVDTQRQALNVARMRLHAATLTGGSPGVLHGAKSYVLQDDDGQTVESHSISAGLDYPGVGPEHAWLHDTGRATYRPINDDAAMEAFALLCRTEGIIPAI